MPTLEELLKDEKGGEYTDVAGYLKDSNYIDSQVVEITDRQIGEIKDQTSTYGEERSQLITFQAERRPDGYDLTKTTLKIGYQLIDGTGGESAPINVKANSDYIQFSWIIPASATRKAGSLLIMVYAIANGYTYKTLAKKYEVKETLEIGGTISEPDANWYTDFIRQMDAKIAQAASSATNAAASASSAEKSKTDAAAILAETEMVKENAIAAITDKCSSYAEIDKIKNVTLSGSSKGSYISVGDSASWRLSNLEIQGKSEQAALTGKNLFNSQVFTDNGWTKKDDEYYGASNLLGAKTLWQNTGLTPPIAISLEIKVEYIDTRYPGAFFTIKYKDGTQGVLGSGTTYSNYTKLYVVATKEIDCIIGSYGISVNITHIKNVQVEAGTEATAYEPYCGGIPAPNPDYPQEIKSVENPVVTVCGKNLFDLKGFLDSRGALYTKNGDAYTINAIGTGFRNPIQLFDSDKQITVSGEVTSTEGASFRIEILNLAGNLVGRVGPGATPVTVVGCKLRLNYATGLEPLGTFANMQIELGSTATTYEPYTGNTAALTDITLRSLPDGTADRLEKRDGVWGIERAIKTITLDGTQRAGKWSDETESHIYSYIQIMDLDYTKNLLCRELPTVMSYPEIYLKDFSVMPGKSSNGTIFALVFMVHKSIAATPDAFQTWLATNNMHVQYALATSTWEPIPDTLQAELNKLESHAGTTNIFTDSPLQPNMRTDYIKDPNKAVSDITTELTNIKERIAAMQA